MSGGRTKMFKSIWTYKNARESSWVISKLLDHLGLGSVENETFRSLHARLSWSERSNDNFGDNLESSTTFDDRRRRTVQR